MARPDLEKSIADALAQGTPDEAAARAIRGYGPEILGYLTRVLGSRAEAGDAFSLFAEQLWKGLAGFEGRSSVRVWAYQIAWNAALRVRSEAWGRRRQRLQTSMASRVAGEVLSRTAVERERESAELTRLRAALDPEEQTLLILRLDRNLTWREVAEVMANDGRPADEPALRKRFERLKAKLAKLAQERGLLE
jgi:RNA polymerase sigma-70 factor (ECF subfamily)